MFVSFDQEAILNEESKVYEVREQSKEKKVEISEYVNEERIEITNESGLKERTRLIDLAIDKYQSFSTIEKRYIIDRK